MSITIYPKATQMEGSFNRGAILENKPVQLSEDEDKLKPFSNLFYWAHAWSDNGSLLGEHPHQAFEIMSFVLRGEIEHYDNQTADWKRLEAGSAQIIRAGSGISHAEKFYPGSHIFQIWIDPDLRKTLMQPPTYNDYAPDVFPISEENGIKVKTYTENNFPITMDAPGIVIKEYFLPEGQYSITLQTGQIHSAYLIEGKIDIERQQMEQDDFAVIKNMDKVSGMVLSPGRLFMLSCPEEPGYATYASRFL